jgi:putative transposase
MGRPHRDVEPGGFYHFGSRGNNRQPLYWVDDDRRDFLDILAASAKQHGWIVFAYCLMPNHFHLVAQVPEGGLSEGMQYLNGGYSRRTNGRYGRTGHLFHNRFWSKAIEGDGQLLWNCRYVVRNPVRAGLCSSPEQWHWSSYRATAGLERAPDFLAVDFIHAFFSDRRAEACLEYRRFVSDGQSPVSDTVAEM